MQEFALIGAKFVVEVAIRRNAGFVAAASLAHTDSRVFPGTGSHPSSQVLWFAQRHEMGAPAVCGQPVFCDPKACCCFFGGSEKREICGRDDIQKFLVPCSWLIIMLFGRLQSIFAGKFRMARGRPSQHRVQLFANSPKLQKSEVPAVFRKRVSRKGMAACHLEFQKESEELSPW